MGILLLLPCCQNFLPFCQRSQCCQHVSCAPPHAPLPQPQLIPGAAPAVWPRGAVAQPLEPQRLKKQSVFTDRKGLALTSVHRFEDAVGKDSVPCPASQAQYHLTEPTTYSLAFSAPQGDSKLVPGAVCYAGGLPARHDAGTGAGSLEDSADAHHI